MELLRLASLIMHKACWAILFLLSFLIQAKQLIKKDDIAIVESVKAASDVYSPLSGEIVSVNEALNDNPELINSSPYDDGWFFKIKPQNNDELEDLLDAEAYAQVSES